jgi:hypothetical protein
MNTKALKKSHTLRSGCHVETVRFLAGANPVESVTLSCPTEIQFYSRKWRDITDGMGQRK